MTLEQKQLIKEKVRANNPLPTDGMVAVAEPDPTPLVPDPPAIYPAALPDELRVEVTGRNGVGAFTLRPHEVSRLRGRYGRGPGFESWVGDRIRDAMISFGGG